MSLPPPHSALVFPEGGGDGGYSIYLNRSGINSIDMPPGKILAEIGGTLQLKFINRGAPIHITVTSSNAGMYTAFFHENLYVVDETVLTIPIQPGCQEGFFDLEIISGYGVMKVSAHVEVIQVRSPASAPPGEPPLMPVARGFPHLLMVMLGIALIAYSAWFYTKIEFLNILSFVTLTVGALYLWYRQG